jgi:hypothetical protein
MTDETTQPDAAEGIDVEPLDEDGTVDEPVEDVTDDGDEDVEPEGEEG